MRRFSVVLSFLILMVSFQNLLVYAEESSVQKMDWYFKTHSVFAANSLHGPGASASGVAQTYDMSLFEWNWGGKQSLLNGAGITSNSNYPLQEGVAFSTHEKLGGVYAFKPGLKAGAELEFYSLSGERVVGRVYGEEIPWDGFDRDGQGAIQVERAQVDLYNAWLEQKGDGWQHKLVGGNLTPRDLPEFSRKEKNHIKLGSFFYRAPITNNSFFEKEDRKLEEGRHPLRGMDWLGNWQYADKRYVSAEIFAGKSKAVPITDIDRDAWGGRISSDILDGNIGITFFKAEGDRPPSIRSERQWALALDSSYPCPFLGTFYGAYAFSDYHRTEKLEGRGAIFGLKRSLPFKAEGKTQYQWLGENYELMGHHKTEHYPSNFSGWNGELTIPVEKVKLKGILYRLQQIETVNQPGDNVFGDSYFPAAANSARGHITMWRLGGEGSLPWKIGTLSAYFEQALFQKDAPTTSSIDKDVHQWNALLKHPLTERLELQLGSRLVAASGRWQAMGFHHRQLIPEIALSYKKGENQRATLIYHRYSFVDSIGASSGGNNYEADQFLLEVLLSF